MLSKFQILLIAALLTSKSLSLVSEKPNFLSWNIFAKRIAMINNGIPISGEDFYVRLRLSHHWITIQNFCGGTVIDGFWVVTSAACVTYPDSTIFTPDQIKVERGVFGNPATLGNRVVHVNKIVVHPQFKILNSIPIFDIALIRLERAVAKRRVIKLCSEGTDEEMEALNLVSMGSTSTEVFEMPEKLQQTTFFDTIFMYPLSWSLELCPDHNICAVPATSGTRFCSGDAGSPLYKRGCPDNTSDERNECLMGVASYYHDLSDEFQCNNCAFFFTNVPYVHEWIEQTILNFNRKR